MKTVFTLFLICFTFFSLNAQKKEQAKDTIKTEIVNIVTKYNPKIADAKKIKKNPKIKLLQKNEKKKLKYTIYAAPVASTFIPKSGVVKGIDVGVKERIYKNYIAAGFGNYATPYFEAFLYHKTRYKNEFGFNAKYLSSEENVKNSVLNSNFSNINAGAFFKREERYFDWKVSLNAERNLYNWFGLPNTSFTEQTINAIKEEQIYNYFEMIGDFTFVDSYFDYSKITASYFTDSYKSAEIFAKFETKIDFPLDFISRNLNNISLKSSLELLQGKFTSDYAGLNKLNYAIYTAKINPEYKTTLAGFSLKLGAKLFGSFDTENNANNFLVYPDVHIEKPIIEKYLNIYGGVTGNLNTNTYKEFSNQNPYISPTLFITQTSEKYNAFIGFKGIINSDISFNLSANLKDEEDKPLFLRNNSKSNGNTNSFLGYEFGNSFNVIYDDVKTTSINTELKYDYSKNLSFALQGSYSIYSLKNALESWNLPTTEASFTSNYKQNKWYASTNIFYVSERKDALYNTIYKSNIIGNETVGSFVDVNLNGGYHFNDKFSAFLKLNNILDTNYQRFANYSTQGFQVLGGFTYKFDF
jgi:hypothetical protein